MSTRAIRALRGEHGLIPTTTVNNNNDDDDDDDIEEEEDEEEIIPKRRTVFTMMNDDDSDDDDDEDDEENDEEDTGNGKGNDDDEVDDKPVRKLQETSTKPKKVTRSTVTASTSNVDNDNEDDFDEENEDDEEDLDALLSEFQEKDQKYDDCEDDEYDNNTEPFVMVNDMKSSYDILLKSLDVKDLDYQYTMRTSMLHYTTNNAGSGNNNVDDERTTSQQQRKVLNLFGPPMDGWIRPPRYVGGGIGMSTYDSLQNTNTNNSILPPWPYNEILSRNNTSNTDASTITTTSTITKNHMKRWYTYIRSDHANRDLQDYYTIQQSGDINALIMFIAHHPYVPEALVQLSNVLYQTNHTAEGMALLRRCLWIYESSSISSFTQHILSGHTYFIDIDRKENTTFLKALFRYIQISYIAGLHRTALATCRLLLSFDPLRDPMNVLLALDYHTIMASRGYGYMNQIHLLEWLVQLVDKEVIPIWYRYGDKSNPTTYQCNILDLPNWAYSYALALFDMQKVMQYIESDDDIHIRIEEIKTKADIAIQSAMRRFPSVVGYILHKLEIDTIGRSFQRDWVTVLDQAAINARELLRHWHSTCTDSFILSSTIRTTDLITKIFVEQSAKLYEQDDVLQWIYDNLVVIQTKDSTSDIPIPPPPPSAAIMRYANVDPADYSNKIQTLPQDANIIDNGLLAHAMTMDPRRPRYLRRNNRREGRDDQDDILFDELGNPFLPQQASFFGPPTEAIDPDWPMTEVFLRSILPWTYVEGLPPPRR